MKIKPIHIVILLFLLSLSFNLFYGLSNEHFFGSDSYSHLRIINNYVQDGSILTYDELSFSGRDVNYPQLFHFFISVFLFLPFYLKIIPALLIASLVIIVYFLSKELTRNETASVISALLIAFSPLVLKSTLNQISPLHLILPLMFLMFYLLIKIEDKRYFNLFLFLVFFIGLIHPISIIFVLGLVFYMLLLNIDNSFLDNRRKELIIFTFFLIAFVNILIYRKSFIFHGFNYVTRDSITSMNSAFLASFNIFTDFFGLGLIVFILGVVGLFFGYYNQKNNIIVLLSGFIITTLLMGILNLINVDLILLILAITFTVTSSLAIVRLLNYLKITKAARFRNYFIFLFVGLIFLLSVFPSFLMANSFEINNDELDDLKWLRENTNKKSVILSIMEEGNYVIGLAERKSILDSNVFLVPNLEQRIDDVEIIYTTWSEAVALDLIRRYNIDYIYFTQRVKEKYNIQEILYTNDERCFTKERETIYKISC
ncbi:hypothetical protein CL617_03925 [archaeon]|nr:hypothetical protein [archaeon]|tara:strand:+ start:13476 stop:14930 length:1455 start_codon:yes stop_codon:yes gene_type:complete